MAKAESGLNPRAKGINKDKKKSTDYGCWQLNDKWQLNPRGIPIEKAYDCKFSTDIAHQIYTERGNSFNAWYAYVNKKHLKHLP